MSDHLLPAPPVTAHALLATYLTEICVKNNRLENDDDPRVSHFSSVGYSGLWSSVNSRDVSVASESLEADSLHWVMAGFIFVGFALPSAITVRLKPPARAITDC